MLFPFLSEKYMSRKSFTEDFKQKIVNLLESGKKTRSELMDEYEISSSNISQWLSQYTSKDKSNTNKKNKKLLFLCFLGGVFFLCLITILVMLGYGNKEEWSVMTQCDFSTDAGATYTPNLKEFKVGDTIYMKVLIKAETNTWFKKTQKPIGITLKIPHIKEIAANYDDGQPITGRDDEINQVTVYEFNVMGSKNPKTVTCIFQFVPNSECNAKVTVEYDDHIPNLYDIQKTIHFVN